MEYYKAQSLDKNLGLQLYCFITRFIVSFFYPTKKFRIDVI